MSNVLIAGRGADHVNQIAEHVRTGTHLRVDTRVIVNGHADPLHEMAELPDLLILVVANNSLAELTALSERPARSRPPLIVISDALDTETMRVAMRAGARDFVREDAEVSVLLGAVEAIAEEIEASQPERSCEVYTILNASGGDGGTMLATNLANLSAKAQTPTALVDLDLQLAPAGHYLDLTPKNSLLEALERIEEMDELSVNAFSTKHASGLDLFAAITSPVIVDRESIEHSVAQFLDILAGAYSRILIDLPEWFDPLSAAVLERSDKVILVIQQSLTSLRNAGKIMDLLRKDLLIPDERIVVVLNRFNRNATLEMSDVRRTLKAESILTLPNQYRVVAESIDIGVPLSEHAPNTQISKALAQVFAHLKGEPEAAPRTFIEKTLSGFLRG